MKKKLLALVMAGVMTLGMLTGCGSGGDDKKDSSQSGTNETQQSGEEQEASDNKEGTGKEEEASASNGEKVTLRMIEKDVSPEDPVYQEWVQKFNEGLDQAGINAQIELVSLQSGTYSENLADRKSVV